MKMKKMFALLITMFLSSCQISSNSETPSEQNSDSISAIESVSNLDVLSDESSLIEDIPSEPTEEPSSESTEQPSTIPSEIPTDEPSSEPTEESSSEEVEDIYYVDGLPSNLFVTEVKDFMKISYLENEDCYKVTLEFNRENYPYDTHIDEIIFPNVYDDGIHGLKRIKHCIGTYYLQYIEVDRIIIPEGIETLRNHYYNFREEKYESHVVDILCYLCNNLYLPLSIKEIGHAVDGFDNKLWEHLENGEREFNIHYNGTVEHFNENCVISMPLTIGPSELHSDEVLKINCLDGYVNLNLYIDDYIIY